MKITIKNGESVENALTYLTDFLNAWKDEYPILAGNLNIYVTLKGFGERICPENDKEYVLSCNGIVDLEEAKINEKKEFTLAGWKKYIAAQYKHRDSAAHAVDLDIEYLKSAEKKKRKPETIEKRKRLLEDNRSLLKTAQDNINLLKELNNRVNENKIKWHIVKKVHGKNQYTYDIHAYIIFENVAGETWYFSSYTSKYTTPYGYLTKGVL